MRPMRIWVGLVLIALGVVGLLDAAGVLDFGTTVDRWWPLGLLALAALLALTERRIGLGSLVIGLLSVILLVDTLDLVVLGVAVWGSLAIAAGLAVLFTVAGPGRQRLLGARSPGSVAIFGGSDTANSSPHFEHADVAAVFGAATLDLRDATPEPGATVDAVALFGGVDVLVPESWRIEMTGVPLFGGFGDKTDAHGRLGADAPVLKVVSTAIFGGVEVKNRKS